MDAAEWDARYATRELVWGAGPNMFLAPEVDGMEPGRAVDLACGEGRNAIWLAEQGWTVTGVDYSGTAVAKAGELAAARGVSVDWICADATDWEGPATAFDLVAVFYLQLPEQERRAAVATACSVLAPHGVLLVVAHDSANLTDGLGGPQDPSVLFGPDDILSDLAAAGIEHEVQRAETVHRPVEGSDRDALDCLVRVRRGD